MTEEKKEKPDWLNDFQNNQATGNKQTSNEEENGRIILDIYGPTHTYTSPRYGRRSNAGVKSVENSPEKSPFQESKSLSARSCSAQSALLNTTISPRAPVYVIRNEQNAENLNSLQFLQNDFEKFSFSDFSETLEKVYNFRPENLLNSKQTYENLEDSWKSLNVFKIKQKGRLGLTTKDVFVKEREENNFTQNIPQKHQQSKNILEKDKFRNKNKKSSDDLKNENKAGNWLESRKICETETPHKTKISEVDKDFIVPELPQGRSLMFNIKTTWGDKHYLGLNGIEIFNSKGKKVQVKSIMADPPDINILPEYSRDPRVVENLIDNIYLTQDDMHMWLVPFTPNSNHLIFIEFNEIEELAMLRVWNYNKSRIHCCRGAKDVEIKLDSRFIFVGEIARASGEILNTLNCLGDTILFTTNDNILELVSENDEYFIYSTLKYLEVDHTMQEELRPLTGGINRKQVRPFTCPKKSHIINTEHSCSTQNKSQESILGILKIDDTEPKTKFYFNLEEVSSNGSENADFVVSLKRNKDSPEKMSYLLYFSYLLMHLGLRMENYFNWEMELSEEKLDFLDQNYTLYIPSTSFLASDSAYETLSMPTGYNFTIQIHSTWGDLYYVGLNGLQIFDENNKEIKIHPNNIIADPESINVLDGIDNDARTPDKLIDGINDSVDGCHMWLAPVLPLTINRIDLTFQDPVTLSTLKLWNYGKTPSRGVREFGVLVDGLLIYNGELDHAVIPTDGGLPKVPCKTVNFTNPSRVQNNKNRMEKEETTNSGTKGQPDQSQRPLTTMTSHS